MRGLAKIGLGILVGLVMATGTASAKCSNTNLDGVYGYSVRGFAEPSGTPIATVGLFTADGAGNISSGQTTNSEGGNVVTDTYTGTYSIAADCTGTVTTTDANSVTNHFFIVLSGIKKEAADLVGTDPELIVSGSARTQGVGVCGLTGKPEAFAEHLTGYAGSVPESVVGRIGTDGKGNITFGVDTVNAGGKAYKPAHISGTYTANSNCTGTAQVSFRNATYNYSYVTVDSGKDYLVIETDGNTTVAGALAQQ